MKPRLLILVLRILCSLAGGSLLAATAGEQSSSTNPLDLARIYPYVVPAAYLEHQSAEPEGLTYPLGHGLYVTLVHDLNGLARDVLGDELRAANLTPTKPTPVLSRTSQHSFVAVP